MLVGKYKLTSVIGEGAFGQVRLGTHVDTGLRVAVKVMDLDRVRKEGMSVHVRREISLLKKLDHPRVVRLVEVLKSSRNLFLVSALAEGGDLFDKMASQEAFDETAARRHFSQMLEGVSYCHSRGICHRDLKPENVLLDAEGNVQITDFGFSRTFLEEGAVLQMYTRCGTPNYIAPEVISGRGYRGPPADVWSLGVILYAIMAGSLPFDEESLPDLYAKIREGEFAFPRHFPSLARGLVSGMLTVAVDDRLTLEGVAAHPWMSSDARLSRARTG
ncbi:putative serine/threonine kinase, partial [Tribonema minus]